MEKQTKTDLLCVAVGLLAVVAATALAIHVYSSSFLSDLKFCQSHNFTWVSHKNFGSTFCNNIDVDGEIISYEIELHNGVWYFVHKGEPTSVSILGG